MEALGDPDAVARLELQRRLLESLALGESAWWTTTELLDSLVEPKPSGEFARRVLVDLAKAGTVDRDPPITVERVQGKKVRWRAHNFTSNGTSLGGSEVQDGCGECGRDLVDTDERARGVCAACAASLLSAGAT